MWPGAVGVSKHNGVTSPAIAGGVAQGAQAVVQRLADDAVNLGGGLKKLLRSSLYFSVTHLFFKRLLD